jgi:hypothetical protein
LGHIILGLKYLLFSHESYAYNSNNDRVEGHVEDEEKEY